VGGSVLIAPTASSVHSAFLPLLFREGVRAELSVLERHRSLQTNSTQRASIETAMVDLSTRNRVLCSLTALLVLETEADYVRFGVSRNARNDVLEITKNGIALQRPSAPQYDIDSRTSKIMLQHQLTWQTRTRRHKERQRREAAVRHRSLCKAWPA